MQNALNRHWQDRTPYYCEHRVRHLDGHYVWVQATGQSIWDDQGKLIFMVVSVFDITDRKESELELQRLNQRYELVFQGSQAGLLYWDIQHDVAEISPQAAQLLGLDYQAQKTTSLREFRQFVHPEDRAILDGAVKAHLNRFAPYNVEYRYRQPSGDYIWIQASGQAIWDDQNQPVSMAISIQDITQRKASEADLVAQNEAFFNVPGAGMWAWDVATMEVRISVRYKEVLGYAPSESLITTFDDFKALVHPDDVSIMETAIARHFEHNEMYAVEFRMRHKAGHYLWVRVEGCASWDEDGEIVSMAGTLQDVSARQETLALLKESERRFHALAENSPGLIWMCDVDSHCTYFNSRWFEFTGRSEAQELGTGWTAGIHPEDLTAYLTAYNQAIHTQDSFVIEYRHRRADGEYRWLLSKAVPRYDAQQTFAGLISTSVDITDNKAREDLLQQTISELEHVTRSKDEFLANMSHELRTPLNAILGLSEGLREQLFGSLNDRQQRHVETIYQSGTHLLELINDILDTTKIGAGKLEISSESIDVASLCDSTLRFVQQQADKKQIQLSSAISPDLPKLIVDVRRIRQALLNFLSNAIKFTPKQGMVCLKAEVLSSSPSGEESLSPLPAPYLRLSVEDSGIGIAEADMKKLYQAFYQVDGSYTREYEGTGLGLYLTRQIAELHGGTVGVRSQLGEGSCFWLDLPIDVNNVSSSAVKTTSIRPPVLTNPTERTRGKGVCVLVAEDNPANVISVESYLSAKGFTVLVANNGQEAVAQALAERPDLILMDIQMPVLNGFDAIRILRQSQECASTPIIALTALAMEGDKEACLAVGANDYLSKPIMLGQLVDKINRFISVR